MDIHRIQREVAQARLKFAFVELHPTGNGEVFVKACFQTTARATYVVSVFFPNYPTQMPRIYVTTPQFSINPPHRYKDGNICYMHPNFWNPGRHDLEFVLARTAKWLNKYDVWRATSTWPGAQIEH